VGLNPPTPNSSGRLDASSKLENDNDSMLPQLGDYHNAFGHRDRWIADDIDEG
jgi:hypothetical protein